MAVVAASNANTLALPLAGTSVTEYTSPAVTVPDRR